MKAFLSFIFIVVAMHPAQAAQVLNFEENIRKLGFDSYYKELWSGRSNKEVKVAVFDYGFGKFEKELGKTIPQNTAVKIRPDDNSGLDVENTHGLAMAQIITQYMTADYNRWSYAPQLYLYKTDGYTNLEWAIEDAIRNKIDVILHSIVIEYGSNYDGRGFYNALINRATNEGIVWINAAGNFGLTTYNATVKLEDNYWVNLGDLENNALPVKCDLSKVKTQNKKCKIRLVLAWDDFKNQPLIGSTKDLDLYLYDNNFESGVTSEMTQIEYNDKRSGNAGTTLYPREIIETYISEGTSYVKVKAKSDNFASTDRLRITAEGDYLSFPVRDKKESLLNPADNPYVITVGEDSERSSISESLNKPELTAPSLVKGDDGKNYRGSSNAAAVVAAGVGLMKKINPSIDRDGILDLALNKSQTPGGNPTGVPLFPDSLQRPGAPVMPSTPTAPYDPGYIVPPELNTSYNFKQSQYTEGEYSQATPPQPGQKVLSTHAIPLKSLGIAPPPGEGCFPLVNIDVVDPCAVADFIVKSRGVLVATNQGPKIAVTYDPVLLVPPTSNGPDMRARLDDVIGINSYSPYSIFVRVPRTEAIPIPTPHGPNRPGFRGHVVEVFQMPMDEIPCKLPDWDFMNRQRDMERDRLYWATRNQGSENVLTSRMCDPAYMAQFNYPISDWSLYPGLQYSPYRAPVGPAPVNVGVVPQSPPAGSYMNNPPSALGPQSGNSNSSGFQLPPPEAVKE